MTPYSHKRTHSVTVKSSDLTYLSPAVKRPRTASVNVTLNPSRLSRPSHQSRIECLPTEILQIIFFTSLNGNLLRAAPRIAAKLSGSRSIYRTAFFVAFYHPHLVQLRDAFKFDYLLPDVEKAILSWDIRSMQKIVLDSRWCTYGWFRGLACELLDYAYNLYRTVYAAGVPSQSLDGLDKLQSKREDILSLSERGGGAIDAGGQYIELVLDPFNLSINIWAEDTEDEEDEHGHWDEEDACDKARRWHLQLRGIGSIPLRSERLRSSYDDGDPFRLLVNEIIWQIPCVKRLRVSKSDTWDYLEAAMLVTISKCQVHLLRELLEIHYFFWPEDAPFKLSPRLFVAAARSDCMEALYLLFQLDPTSFARSSKNLHYLAEELEDHSKGMKATRLFIHRQRHRHIAAGGVYSEEELRRAMQLVCYQEDMEYLDDAIAHYIRTGCIMRKANSISPNFFLRTKSTPVQEICKSKLFGGEKDGLLPDEAEHVCPLAEIVPADGSDTEEVASWTGTDSESWPDMDGLDMYDDEDEFTDDEHPLHRVLPCGLDWTSILIRRGDDRFIQVERKEDYHYMMT
jgi:hypothetical protein